MENVTARVSVRFVHMLPRGMDQSSSMVYGLSEGQEEPNVEQTASLSYTGSLKKETISFALFIETTLTDAVCNA